MPTFSPIVVTAPPPAPPSPADLQAIYLRRHRVPDALATVIREHAFNTPATWQIGGAR